MSIFERYGAFKVSDLKCIHVAPEKVLFFNQKILIFLHENISCGTH